MQTKGIRKMQKNILSSYAEYLKKEEKSPATVQKYLHIAEKFMRFLENRELTCAETLAYKEWLSKRHSSGGLNTVLYALNCFLVFLKREDLKLKPLKIQKQLFLREEKELTKEEYRRLLRVSEKNLRLHLLLQTICSTGIRVSELVFITAEAVRNKTAYIRNKGKSRVVFLPEKLCDLLKAYMKKKNIKSGSIFITRNGKPLDRSNIWSAMKKLCVKAGVSEKKVFPHNLRHLFARTYYEKEKDVVRLADILGHSNVNTTRIYTMESGATHRKQIEALGFLDFGEKDSFENRMKILKRKSKRRKRKRK